MLYVNKEFYFSLQKYYPEHVEGNRGLHLPNVAKFLNTGVGIGDGTAIEDAKALAAVVQAVWKNNIQDFSNGYNRVNK